MKAVTSWSAAPYTPVDRPERALAPYICRIQPEKEKISLGFLDQGGGGNHTLQYRRRGAEHWQIKPLGEASGCTLTDLEDETDYEFFVCRDQDGVSSEIRLARTGAVFGTVVNYLHPDDPAYRFSGQYLCSPSFCRLSDGRLLSSMDVYDYAQPQNLTLLFSSADDGRTWQYVTELMPCFWGRLFSRGDRVYMLSCTAVYGDLQIGVSDDGGRTWSVPTVLFRGGCCNTERGFHRAPMPLLEAEGRLWTAVEFGTWETKEFNNAVLSASADCADYTDPEVWTMTPMWRYAEDPAVPGALGNVIAIEGNLVQAPDGTLYNFLRYQDGLCLRLKLDGKNPEAPLHFADTVPMDINASKFDIQKDPVTGDYFALCSRRVATGPNYRNLLGLFRSSDLVHWACVADVLGDRHYDSQKIGFQYVTFLIEGEDILFLSRTAWNGADNSHNSNYQTFHRIQNFRSLCGPVEP